MIAHIVLFNSMHYILNDRSPMMGTASEYVNVDMLACPSCCSVIAMNYLNYRLLAMAVLKLAPVEVSPSSSLHKIRAYKFSQRGCRRICSLQ